MLLEWCNKHINLTWGIVSLLQILTAFCAFPEPFIIARVLWIVVTIWALWRKKRSYGWVLFPISVLFLSNVRVENNKGVLENGTQTNM